MSGEVSKDEKERQLDAKIAAIRAKNEEKLQRQREVEKDRKLAEKQNQSITTAPRVKKEEDYEHTFVGPDRNDKVNSSKSGKTERRDESFGSGEKKETKQYFCLRYNRIQNRNFYLKTIQCTAKLMNLGNNR